MKNPHKPAFSMGYRGFPRQLNPRGSTSAPTIDQVRAVEKAEGKRKKVVRGKIVDV